MVDAVSAPPRRTSRVEPPGSGDAADTATLGGPVQVHPISVACLVLISVLPVWNYYPGIDATHLALQAALALAILVVAPRLQEVTLLAGVTGLMLGVALRDYPAACAFAPTAVCLFLLQPAVPVRAGLVDRARPLLWALGGWLTAGLCLLALLAAAGQLQSYLWGWQDLFSAWSSGESFQSLLVLILLVWVTLRAWWQVVTRGSPSSVLLGLYCCAALVSVGLNPVSFSAKSEFFILTAYGCVAWPSLKQVKLLPKVEPLPSLRQASVCHSPALGAIAVSGILLPGGATAWLFGVGLRDTLAYCGYVVAFLILPGVVTYCCLFPRCRDGVRIALHGWLLGEALAMWVFLICVAFGKRELFVVYPGVVLVFGMACLWWRGAPRPSRFARRHVGWSWSIVANMLGAAAIVAGLLFSAALFQLTPTVDHHFTLGTAFTNAMLIGWPPEDPFLSGVPLHYHYLTNLDFAAAHLVTGVPVHVLVCRLVVAVHFVLLLALLLRFASMWLGSIWVGALAALQLFATFGYTEVMWGYFHLATASIAMRVPSILIGLELFLMFADEAARFVSQRRWRWARLLLLAFLLLTGAGLRAQLVPVLLVALGAVAAWNIPRNTGRMLRSLVLILAATTALTFALFFFYGFGSQVDATEVLRVRPFSETVAFTDPSGNMSPLFRRIHDVVGVGPLAIVSFVVLVLLGRLGFLGAGLVYFLARRARSGEHGTMELLLCGSYLAGVGALLGLETAFQEQWAFLFYGDLAAALGGALGLCWLLRSKRVVPQTLLLSVAYVGLLLQADDFLPALARQLPKIGERHGGPDFFVGESGLPDTFQWRAAIDWLRENTSPGDVIFVSGDTEELDERPLTAVVPGLTLYAFHRTVEIYSARESLDAGIADRARKLTEPLAPRALEEIRSDVPPTRRLFWLSIGAPGADTRGVAQLRLEAAPLWLYELPAPVSAEH